jgi:hypothetical protein
MMFHVCSDTKKCPGGSKSDHFCTPQVDKRSQVSKALWPMTVGQ